MKLKKHIANTLTGCRILGSILLLFFPAFSAEFYFLYLFCGFSDMIDGTVARKTNSNSQFGAIFDTVSDFVFVAAALIKLLPKIHISIWLWTWIVAIAGVRIGNIIYGFAYQKQFIPPHTVMNKITGFLLFLLPLTLSFADLKYSSVVVCSVATFSAIQEGILLQKSEK